jgi:hypothetical protein
MMASFGFLLYVGVKLNFKTSFDNAEDVLIAVFVMIFASIAVG